MIIEKTAQMVQIVTLLITAILCVRWSASYFSYAIILFALFFLYDLHREGKAVFQIFREDGHIRWMAGGMIIFYGALLLSGLFLGDSASMKEAGDDASFVLPFFMLYYLRDRYDTENAVRWGLTLGSFIMCAFGVYQGYLHPELRIFSFFAHPNHFGTALAMVFPFTAYYAIKVRPVWEKVIFLALALLQLFCLYHTESRGAMVGLAAAVVVTAGAVGFRFRKELNMKQILTSLVIVLVVAAACDGVFDHINANRDKWGQEGGERQLMIAASLDMWKDHPLLGVGLTRWEETYYSEAYHPKEGREAGLSMPHNMPVYFLSTTGILGGAGYAVFLLMTGIVLYRTLAGGDRLLAAAMATAFLAFTIQGLVDTTIVNRIPARLYFGLLGYYLAHVRACHAQSRGRNVGLVREVRQIKT